METLYTADGCSYTGMTRETVERLRAELGCKTEWVSKEVYDSFLDAQRSNK